MLVKEKKKIPMYKKLKLIKIFCEILSILWVKLKQGKR